MEYLRLVFKGMGVYSEWCDKPTEFKCHDPECTNPCKYRIMKDEDRKEGCHD